MPTRSSDLAVCAATLRQGSRSFAAASLLLPESCRGHAVALYGFCRLADDAIDHAAPQNRAAVIANLHAQLDRAIAGHPDNAPIARSFAHALAECAIPPELPRALLEGFAWDAEARRYATLSDLRAYAARVAGTVGVMMALVMNVRDPAALARACDLGVAMQLTNIARDVGEDARAGRLYLPLDWLHAAGIDPDAFLAAPSFSPSAMAWPACWPRPSCSTPAPAPASPPCPAPAAPPSAPRWRSTAKSAASSCAAAATRSIAAPWSAPRASSRWCSAASPPPAPPIGPAPRSPKPPSCCTPCPACRRRRVCIPWSGC
jgi:phytoene/squalene synthetase